MLLSHSLQYGQCFTATQHTSVRSVLTTTRLQRTVPWSSGATTAALRSTATPKLSSAVEPSPNTEQTGEEDTSENEMNDKPTKKKTFWQLDELDKTILGTAVPSMINNAVVPLVNSVDTFWVGRMGIALALAGQTAANNAFFTLYFLVAFLPTITAPLVAEAVGSGDKEAAQDRVCESLFLCNLLGSLGMLLLVGFPRASLRMVLSDTAPAMEYAAPYLRLRGLSMIPALMSATGFAAYRGLLNTVTPLKVSLMTNLLNLVLDPLLIFNLSMGFRGAALATAGAELLSGIIYFRLLLKKRLATWGRMVRPPSWKSLWPILQGGFSVLMRQAVLNTSFVLAARRAQALDPSGVTAAAYGIVMQLYSVGIVVHVAMQGAAAALVSSTRSKAGDNEARSVANRMFSWGSLVGLILGVSQFLALPVLVPLFSTLPEVQKAVRLPAMVASLMHIINGPVFAGEGTMLGLGCYKDLALLTAASVSTLAFSIFFTPLGRQLNGILIAKAIFCAVQGVLVVLHHRRWSPLRVVPPRETNGLATSRRRGLLASLRLRKPRTNIWKIRA